MSLIRVETRILTSSPYDETELTLPDMTWKFFCGVWTYKVGIPEVKVTLPITYDTHEDLISATSFYSKSNRCNILADAIYGIRATYIERKRDIFDALRYVHMDNAQTVSVTSLTPISISAPRVNIDNRNMLRVS